MSDWDKALNLMATDLKDGTKCQVVLQDVWPDDATLLPVASLFDAVLPSYEATLSHVSYHQHTLVIEGQAESKRAALALLAQVRALWNGSASAAKTRLAALKDEGLVHLIPQSGGGVSLRPETMTGPKTGKYRWRIDFTAWEREAN